MTGAIGSEVIDKVRNNRDDLEALAESDLRCAKYARELLALADENGGGR
jgi:hypothetical protein